MTKSRASASLNRASPATEMFRSLLRRVDRLIEPVLSFDEVQRWPDGVRDVLIDLGIVSAIDSTYTVPCDGCAEGHLLEVDVRDYPTGTIGVAKCPECGRVTVPLDRLRQWQPNILGIAERIAEAAGTIGSVQVESPDRLLFLGVFQRDGASWDLFFGRGLTWPDADQVLDASQRIRSSPCPAILVPAIMPTMDQRLPLRPAFGALTELAHLSRQRLVVSLDPLLTQDVVPHVNAKSPKWLTVTEAAEQLITDVDSLDLAKAKARVSAAANRGTFKTNGKTGSARRIDRDSFSRWRLEQRERNLDNADKG